MGISRHKQLNYVYILWLRSQMSPGTSMFISGDSRTRWVPAILGIPQGSVLGCLLWIINTSDIPSHSQHNSAFC